MNIKNLLMGILVFVIGLLLVIVPDQCVKLIVIIVGGYTVFNGVTNLLGLRKKELNERFKKTVIIKNLVAILIGVLSIICPFLLFKSIGIIWKIVSYFLAVCLIASGITGFISATMLSDEDSALKSHISGESIICFLIALLLIIIPIDAVVVTLFKIIGIISLIVGLAIASFEIFKIISAKKASKNEIKVEAVVIDDTDDSADE